MRLKKSVLLFFVVCVLVGTVLGMQMKTIDRALDRSGSQMSRSRQVAQELKRLQDEKEDQTKKLDELELKIKQYEEGNLGKDDIADQLYKDALKYKSLAQFTDVEGPGIILEINDPFIEAESAYTYSIVQNLDYILQIISVLNSADAEAISINDQRYTSRTEIERAGDHIEINGVTTSAPITIKAIGDPETMESALNIKNGVLFYLKRDNFLVQLNKNQNVQILKYKKIKDFIYAVPVENK